MLPPLSLDSSESVPMEAASAIYQNAGAIGLGSTTRDVGVRAGRSRAYVDFKLASGLHQGGDSINRLQFEGVVEQVRSAQSRKEDTF
jgi:hypothetical protein